MTAKEMLKDHKHLLHGYYVFEQEELQAFVNQLCKEQRENCAKEAMVKEIGSQFSEIVADEDSILNAKQPEI